MRITNITAHTILDSNAEWTIQAHVTLENGMHAAASVPSGHSVGKHEAKSVIPETGIENIFTHIVPALVGHEVTDQTGIDQKLKDLDGTEDKKNLGGNTILAVSLACAKAGAKAKEMELYDYLIALYEFPPSVFDQFPIPLINLINGGQHASNSLEFQSFMLAPASFMSYSQSLHNGVAIYHKLKEMLVYKNLKVDVGEEGGFSPSNVDGEQICHFMVEAILESGIKAGTEMFLALDVSANSFYSAPNYQTRGVLGAISAVQLRELYQDFAKNFPIIYIEDPFSEDAWDDWSGITTALGNSVEIIGDDLTATNPERLKTAIEKKCLTGVIVKPNQIGTLTETIEVIKIAHQHNLSVVVSHRAGETAEDTFIADLAVAGGATYIKAGAPARGERTVKYNRLLVIEEQLRAKKSALVNTTQTEGGSTMDEQSPLTPSTTEPTPHPLMDAQAQPIPTDALPNLVNQSASPAQAPSPAPPTPSVAAEAAQPTVPSQGMPLTPRTPEPAPAAPTAPPSVPPVVTTSLEEAAVTPEQPTMPTPSTTPPAPILESPVPMGNTVPAPLTLTESPNTPPITPPAPTPTGSSLPSDMTTHPVAPPAAPPQGNTGELAAGTLFNAVPPQTVQTETPPVSPLNPAPPAPSA